MSFDDDDDNNNISIYDDGCFPDAAEILTEEEYFDKVIFDWDLLQSFGLFNWPINSKQGVLINRQSNQKILEWALIYERYKHDNGNQNSVAFNFGDLLLYVTIDERLKWKRFYQNTNIKIHREDKLLMLFYDKNNNLDSNSVSKYWNGRIENSQETKDQPWFSKEDREQLSQELHFIKQPTIVDQKQGNVYRDINWMYFRQAVLDKYRNNEFCDIGSEYISFLGKDKKTPASTVHFINRNFANIEDIVLMVQAQEYINVPPRERKPHWDQYEIPESEI